MPDLTIPQGEIVKSGVLAERQGFEPWEQLPVHRISSAARSTTPASFLVRWAKLQLFFLSACRKGKKVREIMR